MGTASVYDVRHTQLFVSLFFPSLLSFAHLLSEPAEVLLRLDPIARACHWGLSLGSAVRALSLKFCCRVTAEPDRVLPKRNRTDTNLQNYPKQNSAGTIRKKPNPSGTAPLSSATRSETKQNNTQQNPTKKATRAALLFFGWGFEGSGCCSAGVELSLALCCCALSRLSLVCNSIAIFRIAK